MPKDDIVSYSSQDKKFEDDPTVPERKRLHVFIHDNMDSIVSEWEAFAQTLMPAAESMSPLTLRDHIVQILDFIICDVTVPQSDQQRAAKSLGHDKPDREATAAETHAAIRLAGGFNIKQMVSEYRALRSSIVNLWTRTGVSINAENMTDLIRFNEAIDQEMAESIEYYSDKIIEHNDIFVGVLGHDLRNPLNGVMLSAQLMLHMGALSTQQTLLTTQIMESSGRMNDLIGTLLDVTRARFGGGVQLARVPMDMGFIAHQIVAEVRVTHPARTISLAISGDLKGKWDKVRIGQVFSNLLGNAIQYSFADSSIGVNLWGDGDAVVLQVHNLGIPIPPEGIAGIFNSLRRASSGNPDHRGSTNLGLGLFITEEVVVAHGGTIDVTSSEDDGTTFTVRLPRDVTRADTQVSISSPT